MEVMKPGWIARLGDVVSLPSDSQVERSRKASATVIAVFSLLALVVWSSIFALLGYHLTAVIGALNAVIVILVMIYLLRTRHFAFFLTAMMAMAIVFSLALQTSLGGIGPSGMTAIYGLLAPGAAAIFELRSARFWFGAYMLELLVALGAEVLLTLPDPGVPTMFSNILATANVANVSAYVFGVILYNVRQLRSARQIADDLLLNILPGPIAERLKHQPGTIADGYEEVTVLFADIVDFTRLSAEADPVAVVEKLNTIFSEFDELALRHGLEKIKTIGDAYMVAGGLPEPRPDHAEAIAEMARDMLETLGKHQAWNGEPIRMRIGINSGPVVAGVIGRHKFIYDLWGDAVNVASRMESNGIANIIQVTETTYQKLSGRYHFEAREPIEVKGKGRMATYLLGGQKASFV